MRSIGLVLVGLMMVATAPFAATQPDDPDAAPAGTPRFAFLDVYVDAGDASVAAYQLELVATAGDVTIVGIEGGEHAAFVEPPYYDPAALKESERVIIGAFDTGDDLPHGRTRVARVHVRIAGPAPEYELSLTVAADADGAEIDADATLVEGSAE
jgi:hypothetical protein